MLRFLRPHLRLASVCDLKVGHLRERRLEGLLLDVDCTLKDHGAAEIGLPVAGWMRGLLQEGIRLCLLSNGRPARVGRLARGLGVPYVARAFKPLPFGCHTGAANLRLPLSRVAVVGDQVFADVLAGRLAGAFTILVQPTSSVEPWFTRLKRPFERRLLRWMRVPGVEPEQRPAAPMTS
jgi:HAD superfamily phosphatase (TIGR01668 family)